MRATSALVIGLCGLGDATVVWDQSDGTRSSIWATRFLPGTGWATATLLEASDVGAADDPQVAVDRPATPSRSGSSVPLSDNNDPERSCAV